MEATITDKKVHVSMKPSKGSEAVKEERSKKLSETVWSFSLLELQFACAQQSPSLLGLCIRCRQTVFVSFLSISGAERERNEKIKFYYHTNHLGSTAFVTDNNATVTQGFLYAPFGEITTEFNASFGNGTLPKYSFNAKELDEETGMYYYEARYYNPPVFVSRDPHFERYFWTNPYGYCSNNPLKYVDPSGMDGVVIVDDETQTLTIKATYFVQTKGDERMTYTTDDIKVMNKEINDFLNAEGYSVTKGQYKGYSVKFDLQFKDGGKSYEAETYSEQEKFLNHKIGNTFNRGNQDTHSKYFKPKDGKVTGGITDNAKAITMNSSYDSMRNRIHEIFHTLFYDNDNALKGIGAYYVNQMPNQRDINKLINNCRLPKITQ